MGPFWAHSHHQGAPAAPLGPGRPQEKLGTCRGALGTRRAQKCGRRGPGRGRKKLCREGCLDKGPKCPDFGVPGATPAPAPNILNVDLGVKTHRGTLYVRVYLVVYSTLELKF